MFLNCGPFVSALITAAAARAHLGLFLETCHRLEIMPIRATEITIVLVAILFQPALLMAIGLVASETATAHVTISMAAGVTRVAILRWFIVESITIRSKLSIPDNWPYQGPWRTPMAPSMKPNACGR